MFDNQVATVCMPGKFAALCRKLTKDQRDIVEKIGLGKLINIPSMPIQRMLVESLVEKFNAADRTFTIQGHVVSISPWDVYCILGLVDKGEKIEISRKQADRKFFFLEYAGELRIIVLKGEEESYIDSHTDTLKTHTETHTHPHTHKENKRHRTTSCSEHQRHN